MANPQIVVEYVAKTAGLQQGLRQAEASTQSAGSRLKSFGKAAVVAAGAAGLGALVATMKIGIDEFSEAAKVSAQTEATIKSTGKAANVSAKHVEDLATSLMNKSGVDDEAIQSGENLLLTFTRIRNEAGKGNDVFDQTTKAALDMSVALGTDVKTAAMQLGKALNDPIKGVTKLQRSGVTFTEAQKEQIKTLESTGHHLEAQKIILAEVRKEFGGSAEAAGKTLPGQINILKQSFSNLAGQIVGTLAPALAKVTKFFTEHPTLAKALTFAVLGLAAAMVVLNVALAVTAVVTSPITLAIIAIGVAVAALIVGVVLLVKHWDDVTDAFKKGLDVVKGAALALINWLKANWPYIVGILAGPFGLAVAAIFKNWDKIRDAVSDGLQAVKRVITGSVQMIVGWGVDIAGWIKQGIVNGLAGIGSAAWGVVNNIWSVFLQFSRTVIGWGESMGSWIKTGIVNGIKGVGEAIWGIVRPAINTVIKAINALGHFTVKKHKLPGPIPDIPGFSVTLWNIPLLAKGGIVTSPTLAMIGEKGPEAVVPLSSGGAPPIEVRVFIGETELRGLVRAEVVSQDNRTAQVLLAGAR